VKQVLASLPVRTIQRLTQTYLTLSLADIARAAGLAGAPEAEAVILRMVAHRQVFARINDRDGMVTFMQVRRAVVAVVAAVCSSCGSCGSCGCSCRLQL
jgi:COP9 signalosome complex subunit 3